MLEAPILDAAEQLLVGRGRYLGLESIELLCDGRANVQPWSNLVNTWGAAPLLTNDGVTLLVPASNNYLLKLDTGSLALTVEDPVGKGFQQFWEQPDGLIWAVSNVAGYYGLYRRTLAGSWTQFLADTNRSYIEVWTNGTAYWRSYSGNFYALANGGATVAPDPGFASGLIGSSQWAKSRDWVTQEEVAYEGQYGAGSTTYLPNLMDTSGAFVCKVPWETLVGAQEGDPNPATRRLLRVPGTNYMALVYWKGIPGTRSWVCYVALLNKVTKVAKHIGFFRVQGAVSKPNGTTSPSIDQVPLAVVLKGSVLSVYLSGSTNFHADQTPTQNFGILRANLRVALDF